MLFHELLRMHIEIVVLVDMYDIKGLKALAIKIFHGLLQLSSMSGSEEFIDSKEEYRAVIGRASEVHPVVPEFCAALADMFVKGRVLANKQCAAFYKPIPTAGAPSVCIRSRTDDGDIQVRQASTTKNLRSTWRRRRQHPSGRLGQRGWESLHHLHGSETYATAFIRLEGMSAVLSYLFSVAE